MKIRESVQLQNVLATYDTEINQDRAMQSYQRLKTMVRRHMDQMIRTPNYKARNERITRVSLKSQKRVVSVEEKMGAFSGNWSTCKSQRRKSFRKERVKTVQKNRRVIVGILPYVKITSLYRDANSAINVCLDTLRLMGGPEKSKKSSGKGSVALLKVSIQLICVSQDSHPRKSILREPGMLGSKNAAKFSKGVSQDTRPPKKSIQRKWKIGITPSNSPRARCTP